MNTRLFGEINIEKDKEICFESGLIGFPDYTRYALIFDADKPEKRGISWLQSLEDGQFALPVIDPLLIRSDYAPDIDEEILKTLGELKEENTYVLVTVTATSKKEDISVNLKAPIIINTQTRKAVQVITENDFPVKYKIYDILKEKAGETCAGIDEKKR
ncbi:MAG: flagellar assembly protein FliW [Lachnospiraceae bacterium]|nr:flagellar assembly protein FliW [Lachnospiraceae bacterium]